MDYSVTTSPNIGSRSRSSVNDGRHSIPISGLQEGRTYTWTIQVTNGQASNQATYRFTTESSQPPPPPPPPPSGSSDIPSWGYFGRLFDLTYQEQIGIRDNLDIIETRGRYANIAPMDFLREGNPDIKIIAYYNIWTINENTDDINLARSRGWILHDAQGNEVYAKGWPQNRILNVANKGASDFIAGKVKTLVDTYDLDGIKGDGTKAILETTYDISAMPINPSTGNTYTLNAWRNAMVNHVLNIKNKMGYDKIYIGNGKGANVGSGAFGFWANEDLVAPLIAAEDGVHLEGYIRWSNENWRSESRWLQDMEFINYLCSNNKYALPVITTKGTMPPGATMDQVVLFGVATNLLAIENGLSHIGVSSETPEALNYLYELNDLPVGTPIESYSKRSGTSVYEREFTNSLILVNSGNSAYTFNLGRTYYRTNGQSVSRITVNAHTGVILLKTNG
ncbi:MAG: putative glycoside hydrolase [Candidatus Hodarchaeales archaeon]